MVLVFGACTSTGDSDDAASADSREASMCVEVVRLAARGQVDASLRSEGEPPRFYPEDADVVAAYRDALPADFADQLDLVLDPSASPEELEAAGAAVDQLLAEQCGLGADGTSPLTEDCKRDGMQLARSVASAADVGDELAAFAENCAPADGPFSQLSSSCQGLVYSHYVRPSIEGEFSAGFPSTDDEDAIAAAFVERCDQ